MVLVRVDVLSTGGLYYEIREDAFDVLELIQFVGREYGPNAIVSSTELSAEEVVWLGALRADGALEEYRLAIYEISRRS